MISETDDYSPYRMEVEEASPSNRKPVSYDDIYQTFELSTQNSTQNQIAHNDSIRFSNEFEEEIENDSSDLDVSYSRQPIEIIEKLRLATKTGQICNTFEEDYTRFNAQIFEQTSSRGAEEEKIDRSVECYNEPGPVLMTEPTNILHHASGNENTTQLANSPIQTVQDLVQKDPASGKKTSKKRVEYSVDDGKNHDLNCPPQDLTFPQAPTMPRTVNEIAAMDEDIKRLPAKRCQIPLISKAVLKYSIKDKGFKEELAICCQQEKISVEEVNTYLEKNIKGKKEGKFTRNDTPLQQAKIANEPDVLGLLGLNGNNDPLLEVKHGANLAFGLFFSKGFYEHWVEDQYHRIWLKKGIELANKNRTTYLTYKDAISFLFLKYKP